MCGICGIRRFTNEPIERSAVDLLILNNQNRGIDATGVALQQEDGTIEVCKNDVPPFEFIGSNIYKTFMDKHFNDKTLTVLGHTRKATQGTPRDNRNNHPMWKDVTAVIHNGVIHNDAQLFTQFKLERSAETDSDILRAILDANGLTPKAVELLEKCSGNAAFAAISTKYPGKLLLGRSGNPIELAATKHHLYFSSETGPIYKALRPFKFAWGILMRDMTPNDYCMITMEDHSAWCLGSKPRNGVKSREDDWLEWHQKMKITYNFQPVNYTCHSQYHGSRVRFYDDRPVDLVECPGCGLYLNVTQAQLKDLKKFTCASCKSPLLLVDAKGTNAKTKGK